jgi:hypothetical protein
MKIFKRLLVGLVCQLLIFSNILWAGEQLSLPSPDITAPEVSHNPITDPIVSESDVTIQANVTDNVQVKSATLFYRIIGDKNYQQLNMKRVGGTDTYSARIEKVPSPGIEYYIQAEDSAGNTLLHGYSFSPLVVKAQPSVEPATVESLAVTESPAEAAVPAAPKKKPSGMKWVWIGLGALAVGAIAAAAGGGGGGDSGTSTDQGTVVVSAPTP